MKVLKYTLGLILAGFLTVSCEDQVHDSKMPFPNDVTFNEQEESLVGITVPELDFVQLDAPFTAKAYKQGAITLNAKKNADGTHTGFALSNKNYRSFPWCNSKPHGSENVPAATLKSATDTLLYSCYTGSYPNQLKNFVVVRCEGEEAYFTIDKPRVVEHVLVANNTYNYMALSYGNMYSAQLDAQSKYYVEKKANGTLATVRNPNIPDAASSKYGVWYLPDYYNFARGEQYLRLGANSKGYVKITAKGYKGGAATATVDYYIAVRTGVAPAPYDKWNTIQGAWAKWDLTGLGEVDKVVFTMDGSDKFADGSMKIPAYFCMDGIRLK